MMLRFIMRYLMNNERIISRLADSRPMRRAAQFVVYMLTRVSSVSGVPKLPSDPKEFAIQLKKMAQKYTQEFKSSIENAKEEMKKK